MKKKRCPTTTTTTATTDNHHLAHRHPAHHHGEASRLAPLRSGPLFPLLLRPTLGACVWLGGCSACCCVPLDVLLFVDKHGDTKTPYLVFCKRLTVVLRTVTAYGARCTRDKKTRFGPLKEKTTSIFNNIRCDSLTLAILTGRSR